MSPLLVGNKFDDDLKLMNSLNAYTWAFENGVTFSSENYTTIKTLRGRILRGKSPRDFWTLTDDPRRKLITMLGADSLNQLIGMSGHEILISIGATKEFTKKKFFDEHNEYKLIIFAAKEAGSPCLADWNNTVELTAKVRDMLGVLIEKEYLDLSKPSFFTLSSFTCSSSYSVC
jgi:hypothetical protein